ncbi:nucleoside triphosphate pyrophosphohydrolase [bacterium]|nr:nucleoside triphosphate pyrophosphohydrolase [candidate division CSSED10-310 bacterium]
MQSKEPRELFAHLLEIIKKLRAPDGCPWDRKQTHQSLIPFMLEEAHEAVAAIEEGNMDELAGELGDVMLQVVLHSEIASEHPAGNREGGFDISIVLEKICGKLIHRHPHVFGNVTVDGAEQVLENWQKIKADEKTVDPVEGILHSVSPALPQLLVAQKYQQRAALVGFDWDDISDVFEKIQEEIREVQYEIDNESEMKRVEDEVGDLLFAIVNLSRFLGVNAEEALRKANNKFKRRFNKLERVYGGAENMKGKSLEELDLEWDRVKESEKKSDLTH